MASPNYGKYVFGLRRLVVTNSAGTLQEQLEAGQSFSFEPEFRVGEQFGDDALKAVISFIIGGSGEFSAGALSTAAIAIITGKTLSVSGSNPNEITELKWSAGDVMPYFKVYGLARDEGGGDIHILLSKVKLVGGLSLAIEDNEFVTPGFEVRVVDDGTNGVARILQHQTTTTLPTS